MDSHARIASDDAIIEALSPVLKPEYQPAPVFTPQQCAVEYLNDFAGCYALTPVARRNLQNTINAVAQNQTVAPSERTAYINSTVAYFGAILQSDPALEPADRERRIDQLHRSLNDLTEAYELPALSMASFIESQRPRRATHAEKADAPLTEYKQAKTFLVEFAKTYAHEPRDHELLQGAISITARGRSPIGRQDRDVARNEILRHFENKVRKVELKAASDEAEGVRDIELRGKLISDAADKAEQVNLKLGESLRALQYGFALDAGASASR